MSSDLQVIQAQAVLPVSAVEYLQGVTPQSVRILGGPYRSVDEVRIGGQLSPSYVIASEQEIVAQIPPGLFGGSAQISILSSDLMGADHVLIRHRLGAQTRKVRGMPRLVQTFMRTLLMTPGTSLANPALGGGLLEALRSSYGPSDIQGLQADAYRAVQRAQEQIVSLQARDPSLSRSERLMAAKVLRCGGTPEGQLVMDIDLLNQTGKSFLLSSELLPSGDDESQVVLVELRGVRGVGVPRVCEVQLRP